MADEVTVTIQTNNQIIDHPLNTFLRARNIYNIDHSFRVTFRDNEWVVFRATEVGVNLSAWQRDFAVQSVRFANTLTDMARTRLIPVGGDVWCYAELTRAEDWRQVPGKQKPADIASRELAATGRAGLRRWLTGPEFLAESPGK